MTGLTALAARNVLLNRAVISGMLKGKSLIRFTVWTRHTSGVQVEIKKALREGSIFLSEERPILGKRATSLNDPCRWKTRLQVPIRIWIQNDFRLRLLLNHSKDTLS